MDTKKHLLIEVSVQHKVPIGMKLFHFRAKPSLNIKTLDSNQSFSPPKPHIQTSKPSPYYKDGPYYVEVIKNRAPVTTDASVSILISNNVSKPSKVVGYYGDSLSSNCDC